MTGRPGAKPTMMGEQRYESGTQEDPWIQRRNLYQCVFAGGCGYAYGHNALWQMTPHTAQPWMLKGWNPASAIGVRPSIRRRSTASPNHSAALCASLSSRIPDQSLVLAVKERTSSPASKRPGRHAWKKRRHRPLCLHHDAAARNSQHGRDRARTLRWSWFNPRPAKLRSPPATQKFGHPHGRTALRRARLGGGGRGELPR